MGNGMSVSLVEHINYGDGFRIKPGAGEKLNPGVAPELILDLSPEHTEERKTFKKSKGDVSMICNSCLGVGAGAQKSRMWLGFCVPARWMTGTLDDRYAARKQRWRIMNIGCLY